MMLPLVERFKVKEIYGALSGLTYSQDVANYNVELFSYF
jgi:hypothetical protein